MEPWGVADSHHFDEDYDSDPQLRYTADPHSSEKLDPGPHLSDAYRYPQNSSKTIFFFIKGKNKSPLAEDVSRGQKCIFGKVPTLHQIFQDYLS